MRWEQKPFDKSKKDRLEKEQVLPLIATLLSNRPTPVNSKKDIAAFVSSPLSRLQNPASIAGLETAAELLRVPCKKAVVFGDYDVDGITSSYMMRRLLHNLGIAEVRIFLPDRFRDGYGLSDRSIEHFLTLAAGKGFEMFIALDCGSSSFQQIQAVKEAIPGARTLVVDHHIVSEDTFSSNADTVVNPRISDSDPLCTGGLVYQLARYADPENADALLPYAALATVADVCELRDSNRIIVKQGLRAMKECKDFGLKALLGVAQIEPERCTSEDIGFKIAPMINAAGRIESATSALKALEAENLTEALEAASKLRGLNDARKRLQFDILEEIENKLPDGQPSSILVHDPKWHIGIVGIVAGKLAEKYNCPALCFGQGPRGVTGSARSVGDIHIKEVMDDCSEMFERYGGHEQAAGATLKAEYADRAPLIFDQAVRNHMKSKGLKQIPIYYDEVADDRFIRKLGNKICTMIEALGPFGNCNERPLLRANGLQCSKVMQWKSNKGGFVIFDKIKGIDCHAMVPDLKDMLEGQTVDILFKIEPSFKDDADWALRIENARITEPA